MRVVGTLTGAKNSKRKGKQDVAGASGHVEDIDDEEKLPEKGHKREGEREGRREGEREGRREGEREGKREGRREGRREGVREAEREGEREGERDVKREGERDVKREGERDVKREGERDVKREGERDVKRDASSPSTPAGARAADAQNVRGHGEGGTERCGAELEDQRGVSVRVKARSRKAGKRAVAEVESSDGEDSSEEESGGSSGSEEKYDEEEDESDDDETGYGSDDDGRRGGRAQGARNHRYKGKRGHATGASGSDDPACGGGLRAEDGEAGGVGDWFNGKVGRSDPATPPLFASARGDSPLDASGVPIIPSST
ncbi:unnamed protein product [Closterium sp. Naga37s-1]|nr:unnamed protein product [Closterium sp. Naga37s-1]